MSFSSKSRLTQKPGQVAILNSRKSDSVPNQKPGQAATLNMSLFKDQAVPTQKPGQVATLPPPPPSPFCPPPPLTFLSLPCKIKVISYEDLICFFKCVFVSSCSYLSHLHMIQNYFNLYPTLFFTLFKIHFLGRQVFPFNSMLVLFVYWLGLLFYGQDLLFLSWLGCFFPIGWNAFL